MVKKYTGPPKLLYPHDDYNITCPQMVLLQPYFLFKN